MSVENVSGFQNSSDLSSQVSWSVFPVLALMFFVSTVLGNLTVLLIFVKAQSLRTPFSVYLMNLMTVNTLSCLFENPFDIMNGLYGAWLFGDSSCSAYLYGIWVISGLQVFSHALITINRLWAMFAPMSYKTRHTHLVACLLCFAAWLLVHLSVLPGFINDTLYYRIVPLDANGCYLNAEAQKGWEVFQQFGIFWFPEILMIVAYPVLWRARKGKVGSKPASFATNEQSVSVTNAAKLRRRRDQSTSAFLILSLTTISITVCWTPQNMLYTVATFIQIDSVTVYQVVGLINSFQAMIDPVLFTLALRELRFEMKRTFGGSVS